MLRPGGHFTTSIAAFVRLVSRHVLAAARSEDWFLEDEDEAGAETE